MGPLQNFEPQKRKWLKRLFIGIVVAFVTFAAIWNQTKSPNGSPTSATSVGSQPPVVSTPDLPISNPTTTPIPTTTTGSPPVKTKPPHRPTKPTPPDRSARQPNTKAAAVKAAQVAINNLSAGLFLVHKGANGKYHPSRQLVAMVKHLVAPSKQKFILDSAPTAAAYLAVAWHWPSIEAASVGANYYVDTLQYKVTNFKKGKATIWLNTKTGFTTLPAPNQNPPDPGGNHYAPDLTVVHMVRVKGHWLFVDSHELPQVGATFTRMARGLDYSVYEDALRPFMTGGFRNADDLR